MILLSSKDSFMPPDGVGLVVMTFADSSTDDIFSASLMAAPWAMLSADTFSVSRLDASHVAAQPLLPSRRRRRRRHQRLRYGARVGGAKTLKLFHFKCFSLCGHR